MAEEIARDQRGVVSRRQLRDLDVTRHHVRSEVRAGRWRVHGQQAVAIHTAELDQHTRWWSALFEVGRDAALDGVTTALIAAGLEG